MDRERRASLKAITDDRERAVFLCRMLVLNEQNEQPTLVDDPMLEQLHVDREVLLPWTKDGEKVDVLELSRALYEHYTGETSPHSGPTEATQNAQSVGGEIINLNRMAILFPVPCDACGAAVGEMCIYDGEPQDNRHDVRMAAILKRGMRL